MDNIKQAIKTKNYSVNFVVHEIEDGSIIQIYEMELEQLSNCSKDDLKAGRQLLFGMIFSATLFLIPYKPTEPYNIITILLSLCIGAPIISLIFSYVVIHKKNSCKKIVDKIRKRIK